MLFKRLFCKHDFKHLVKVGEWFPTFHTTNGLDDEDERILVFRCDECNKRLERKQIKVRGRVINYKYILIEGDKL